MQMNGNFKYPSLRLLFLNINNDLPGCRKQRVIGGANAMGYQATHTHIQLMINYETKINIVTILTIGQTQRVRRSPLPLPGKKG